MQATGDSGEIQLKLFILTVMPVSQVSTGEAAVGQGAQSVPTVRPQRNDSGQSVKQEMAR